MPRVGLWFEASLDAKGCSVISDFSCCQGLVCGQWPLLMRRVGMWSVTSLDAKGCSVISDFS